MDAPLYDALTDSERDVLRRLAGGRRAGEIAADLSRSISTIRNQLHSARGKAGSSDSLALARALVAHEAGAGEPHGQTMPGHAMPIATPADVGPPVASPPDRGMLPFDEDRMIFDFGLSASPPPAHPHGARRHDLTPPPVPNLIVKLAIILGVAVLAMMCIALAPDMGRTVQAIADRLYPSHPD